MIIDIAFAIIVVSGFLVGYSRGLISSLISFLAFVAGIVVALKYTHVVAGYLQELFAINAQYLPLLSFLLIFIGVIVLMHFLAKLLEKIVGFLFLGMLNRIIGALLWGIIFVLGFSTVLWFLNQTHMISPEMKAQSQTFYYIEPLTGIVFGYLSQFLPVLEGVFQSIEEMFRDIDKGNL